MYHLTSVSGCHFRWMSIFGNRILQNSSLLYIAEKIKRPPDEWYKETIRVYENVFDKFFNPHRRLCHSEKSKCTWITVKMVPHCTIWVTITSVRVKIYQIKFSCTLSLFVPFIWRPLHFFRCFPFFILTFCVICTLVLLFPCGLSV